MNLSNGQGTLLNVLEKFEAAQGFQEHKKQNNILQWETTNCQESYQCLYNQPKQ